MKPKQPSPFAVPFDLAECRRRCLVSMLNTPVGHWLAAACNEVERLRAVTEPVLDLVSNWQRDGRNGHCLPVIRGELLELIERYIEKRKKQ